MMEYSRNPTALHDTKALYHRIIQPTYERSVIKHVYDNKISLKSGATAQLLNKRPKTTGYLGKRNLNDTPSTYWYPKSPLSHTIASRSPSRIAPSRMTQESRSTVYPHLTDDRNLKASTQSNTFSATTRVREIPVPGIYKVEIQQFRTRSPSGRGVRAAPITNRSLIGTQSTKSSMIGGPTASEKTALADNTCQVIRIQKEQERHRYSREMKRHAQISEHRMDRMYYMNGVTAKLHSKYEIDGDDLERLESIAVSRGIKLPVHGSISYTHQTSTYAPTSTPRSVGNDQLEDAASSAKTVIPTADVASTQGDVTSQEGDDISEPASHVVSSSGKTDVATSDHGDDVADVEPTATEGEQETPTNHITEDDSYNHVTQPQKLEVSETFFTDLTQE